MRSHLELRLAIFHVAQKIEEQAGASQFGVTIEAENENLLLRRGHSSKIHVAK
jgi:hypothetical protein